MNMIFLLYSRFMTLPCHLPLFFFFFNDTATTEIYTLSLHDALPICNALALAAGQFQAALAHLGVVAAREALDRSEEHTSELQSRLHLVCRLLLEKKKKDTSARPRPRSTTSTRSHRTTRLLAPASGRS